ncbi:MAG TPA: glycosyltransferase family 2 protein [Epulopiscium sp.]|nr:glycosyltransferase family 2 protein [Candidatus Epulonipiscium sp.]
MLISIIIPCYNVEDYIEECVHSAFAQTYTHIEVICIDNNSSDGTWLKLQLLKQHYPQLIIDKEPKPGAPAARNKGLLLAKGDWIQFLDADDLLLPNKIEHQVQLIQKQPNAIFIAGATIKRDVEGKETTVIPQEGNPFKSLFITQLGNTCSNLWNRLYLDKIGGWDETLQSSQEADLMFRLLQLSEEVIIDSKPLTIVRERESGQISQGNRTENWARYYNKRQEMVAWLQQNRPQDYAADKEFYNDTFFGILKIIASKDFKTANQLYKKHFKGRYSPSVHQMHSTSFYLRLHKILGFRMAEMSRRVLDWMRNKKKTT